MQKALRPLADILASILAKDPIRSREEVKMMSRRKLRLVMIALVLAVIVTLAVASVASACPPCPGGYGYKVVPGDTWYGVSRKTGVSVSALMSANPALVRWNNWLYACDSMWIPCCPQPCCPQPTYGYWYQVVPGDTWYGVSWKTGRSYYTLWNANPAHHHWCNWLYAGHWLWIP